MTINTVSPVTVERFKIALANARDVTMTVNDDGHMILGFTAADPDDGEICEYAMRVLDERYV